MIKATNQQQPAMSVGCPFCGEQFNNKRRAWDHVEGKKECAEKYKEAIKRVGARLSFAA